MITGADAAAIAAHRTAPHRVAVRHEPHPTATAIRRLQINLGYVALLLAAIFGAGWLPLWTAVR